MNGMNEEELLELCGTEKLKNGIAKWKYWTAEVYSFGKYMRKYAYYPTFLPLYCYTDHGAGCYFDEVAKHELESDAPIQFYNSPISTELFKKVSNKPCYTMLSPFVICRRWNKIEQCQNAKGTLAFPAHSTPEIDDFSDIELYIQQLKDMPEEFQPISVCLHMHDINKGQHKIFLKNDIPVYTAGNAFDQRFAERFYDILKNFKYTTSNMIGSYAYYSVEMGIPFSIYGDKPVLINKADPNLEKGEYKFQENPGYQTLYTLFEGLNKEISLEQKEYVEKHLGLHDGLSRIEMAKILYTAYFKRGNIIKDLLFDINSCRKYLKLKIKEKIKKNKEITTNIFSIKKHLNKIMIKIFGVKITFHLPKTTLVKNYFKTNFKKNALVIYIVDPFLGYSHFAHSNATEGYIGAQILSSLGYNVDILDCQTEKDKDFHSKYDVVYGKARIQALFSGAKVIQYSGGTAHKDLNKPTLLRAHDFYKKSKLDPTKSIRFCENFILIFAYANIMLGNHVVANSYKIEGIEQKLFPIDGFYFDAYDIDINKKDFKSAKTHFLWWGSTGAIHKGLDLVLEIFKNRPDLTLHICGFKKIETEFYEYYKKELNNEIPNIINHEFVGINGDLFKKLMNQCASVVSPSISEGGAIGILNILANGGIIPIISEASGLDVGHYGFMFENLDIATINSMIDKFLMLNEFEMKNLSTQVKNETRERYSIDNHKNKLTEILKEILND